MMVIPTEGLKPVALGQGGRLGGVVRMMVIPTEGLKLAYEDSAGLWIEGQNDGYPD